MEVHSNSGASDPLQDGPLSEDGGFLDWIFERKSGLESCGVNHQYTREERDKLSNCESIDYLPPNSSVYRSWLARQPHRYLSASSGPFRNLQPRTLAHHVCDTELKLSRHMMHNLDQLTQQASQ